MSDTWLVTGFLLLWLLLHLLNWWAERRQRRAHSRKVWGANWGDEEDKE